MSVLINKGLLFILILPVLVQNPIKIHTVAALIAAVIFSSLASYLEEERARTAVLLHCIAALLWTPLAFFLPLTAYDCYSSQKPWLRLLWLLPLARGATVLSPSAFFFCAALCCLAVLLAHREAQYRRLLQEYHQVRDDTTEFSLRLEQQNKELRKNQDYEVELATLTERNRIAREIHDNVGHLLTRSILQVSALQVVHSRDPALTEQLTAVKATLTDAMDNVRSSVHNLHEDATDLRRQLTALTADFSFCPVALTFDCGPLPREVNYAVMAVVKEALSNIARHSNADKASISVLEHPSIYQIIIHDNGTARSTADAKGMGLSNMEERVLALEGIFRIQRTKGFKIFISIPKTPKEDKQHESDSYRR